MEFSLTFGVAVAACAVFLLITIVQMFRDSLSPVQWILLTFLLAVPPGWHLAETNKQRKADEIAAAELAKQQAEEKARLEFQQKREAIANNRTAAVGTEHAMVGLKNGKMLEHVTIKEFKDDGIIFTSQVGLAHPKWEDLPDDWVSKFRDPVTGDAADRKTGDEAKALAEMEKAGCDVDVSFVRSSNEKEASAPLRGSVVKVLSYNKGGPKDYNGQDIYIIGLAQEAFSSTPMHHLRIYPVPQRVLLYTIDKKGAFLPGERVRMYCGSAALALQLTREAGASVTEVAKLQFPGTGR